MKEKLPGRVRIIGGKWRGRILPVVSHLSLRPTPDRVRETLFNWLMGHLQNTVCLDLFAGTGALGFEALSRGAKKVVFLEKHPPAFKALQKVAEDLGALEACEIILSDALLWLQKSHSPKETFDVIFLDPPFASSLLIQSLQLLAKSTLISKQTLIYIETAHPLSTEDLPFHWQMLKQKSAGGVAYHLIEVKENADLFSGRGGSG